MTHSDCDIKTDSQQNGDRHRGNIREREIDIILAGMNRFVCRAFDGEVQFIVMHGQRNGLALADDAEQQRERERDVVPGLGDPVALIDLQPAGALCLHDGAQFLDDQGNDLEHKPDAEGDRVGHLPFLKPQNHFTEVRREQNRVERGDHQEDAQGIHRALVKIIPVKAHLHRVAEQLKVSLEENKLLPDFRFPEQSDDKPQQKNEA